MIAAEQIKEWENTLPVFNKLRQLQPAAWLNPRLDNNLDGLPVHFTDMEKAEALWHQFAPYLATVFPETAKANGIIESPLKEIPGFKKIREAAGKTLPLGKYFLKCDDQLPVAGSVKARGGIYEVLSFAAQKAQEAGLLQPHDDYSKLANDEFRQFFSRFHIGVGSTGNLGLSIGIISARLGFRVSVYMSADARAWKKNLLRSKGVEVVEFPGDFGMAVKEGRAKTLADPMGYFVDDENSRKLFLGYSTAAFRLQKQLAELQILPDKQHPLFVYLPCGVGGAPGGITFGLKQLFGEHVHCFLVEPVHAPSVLLGLATGMLDKISVQDVGIDNLTEADGLAVGRPSGFASGINQKLVSGVYTIEDSELFCLLAQLADSERMFIEPSAAAGLAGPEIIERTTYSATHQIDPSTVTHIIWSTGGNLVPQSDREQFYARGKKSGC